MEDVYTNYKKMAEVECAVCLKNIQGRILSALGKTYHPEHFACAGCKQPITDDRFQINDGDPFCAKCYIKIFHSTCKACNQPIKEKIIKALGANWHEEHFVCTTCGKLLSNTTFFEKNCNPYCEHDYHLNFSARCKGCNKPVTDKIIVALNEKWHPDCFICVKCQKPVIEETFQVINNQPFCSQCTN